MTDIFIKHCKISTKVCIFGGYQQACNCGKSRDNSTHGI